MDEAGKKSGTCLTGTALKCIAVVAMLLDHIGAGLIEMGILRGDLMIGRMLSSEYGMRWWQNWRSADLILRGIGRIAFPLFCFLLVEGFLHTKNVRKYILSLFLFALISEIPFDLVFSDRWVDWSGQNVFFTLGFGLLTLVALRRYEAQSVLEMVVIAAGCAAAFFCRTDYDAVGILLIVSFYLLRERGAYRYIVNGALMVYESAGLFGAAVLALIPIALYNGQRGKMRLKYIFYWFYPAHMTIIFLFRYFMNGIFF